MTKIWEAFWKADPAGRTPAAPLDGPPLWPCYAAVIFLAALTVIVGLAPGPFLAFAETSAAQLLSPEDYINAVLGAQE